MIDPAQIPDEVVEAAAKAIYEAWCKFHGVTDTSMSWEEIDTEERDACIFEARAALSVARAAIREECARVADKKSDEWTAKWREGLKCDSHLEGMSDGAEEIAAAIRAME